MSNTIVESKCPTCAANLSAATTMDDPTAVPSVGDVSVCLYCGEVLEFTEDMSLKKIDIETLVEADFVQLSQIQRFVRYYQSVTNPVDNSHG